VDRSHLSCVPAAFLLVGLGLSVASAMPVRADPPSLDACIRYQSEARFGGVGYDHLVHIANSCSTTAECTVTTDVSPQPRKVEVPGKSEVTVNTFLDSPARSFIPRVECTMQK
jgi:hypothetical protein